MRVERKYLFLLRIGIAIGLFFSLVASSLTNLLLNYFPDDTALTNAIVSEQFAPALQLRANTSSSSVTGEDLEETTDDAVPLLLLLPDRSASAFSQIGANASSTAAWALETADVRNTAPSSRRRSYTSRSGVSRTLDLTAHHSAPASQIRANTSSSVATGRSPKRVTTVPLLPEYAYDMHIRRRSWCPSQINHLNLSRKRWERKRNKQSDWTQLTIDDKWGFYVFAKSLGFNVPKIMFCSTLGPSKLYEWTPPENLGFVVKPRFGGLATGVYVFQRGFDTRERLSGENMSRDNVVEKLQRLSEQWERFSSFHVEEVMLGNGDQEEPPIDYKVFVADGFVISVSIIFNRGSENQCVGIVDENFNRMDNHGCFANQSYKQKEIRPEDGSCRVPLRGFRPVGITQKRCSAFAKPPEWDVLLRAARRFSSAIGIWARVDLYWHQGEPFLGEVEFVPTQAKFHCQSRLDADGCLDPCVHGRIWKQNNEKYGSVEGGPMLAEPASLRSWAQLSAQERCEKVMEA